MDDRDATILEIHDLLLDVEKRRSDIHESVIHFKMLHSKEEEEERREKRKTM